MAPKKVSYIFSIILWIFFVFEITKKVGLLGISKFHSFGIWPRSFHSFIHQCVVRVFKELGFETRDKSDAEFEEMLHVSVTKLIPWNIIFYMCFRLEVYPLLQ